MRRRTFIKGAVAAAVAASIPGAANPYLSANEWQPAGYTYKTFRTARQWTYEGRSVMTMVPEGHELTNRMIEALCRSMAQTKERVAADIFNRAFGDPNEE
jgi:hypothetical protein